MFDYIFKPKSIALVGASRDNNSLGHDVLENVKKLGFKGKIYPVNLKAKKILGLACYKSVLDIKGQVDLAIIMVPAKFVNEVIHECGKKKIKGVVVISAGFKESGLEGAAREKDLQALAKKYHIKLIGPNCLGIINPHINLNASFAKGLPQPGQVGLISQSGAMAVAILDWAYCSNIGFSKIISIGNKAGLTEIELMKYLSSDPETKVIMMYLESISCGQTFMKLSDQITNKKPIIVLKAGTSAQGSQAISSHTGSLAGSDQAVETAFRQCGVIRARSVEDFFDFAKAFSHLPLPRGNRVAVVTNAGGPGIMATDAIAKSSLKLADFSKATKKYLKNHLPKAAAIHNPVDIIGDALADRYQIALQAVIKDPNVDAVIVILTPQTMTQKKETALLIAKLAKSTHKPVLPVFMGCAEVSSGLMVLHQHDVPNFEYCERAVRALEKMYLAKRIKTAIVLPKYLEKNKKLKVNTSKLQIRTMEAEKILAAYDIPFQHSTLLRRREEIKNICHWPVAMKIASRDIIHKKNSHALEININTPGQAELAFDRIIKNVKTKFNKAEVEGILVQDMALQKHEEVIIGMKRDATFGPLIMFGLGGSFVEILKDVSFRLAPLNRQQALQQIAEIKSAKMLLAYDTNFLADLLIKISHLALDYPQIKELDLNPVFVYQKGGSVIDVRMIL